MLPFTMYAIENTAISMGVFVSAEQQDIPSESKLFLANRIKKAVASSGYTDNNPTGRFAVVATCDILSKDVAPTTPPRLSTKLEVSFMVVDLIENKIFDSCESTVSGMGTNETKTFNSAFQKISSTNKSLSDLLNRAQYKILQYYTNSCSAIIREAETLADMDEYDKAIFSLTSVPPVCAECYEKCQEIAITIYQKKIDTQCLQLLQNARSKWAAAPTSETASEIAEIIGQIDPRSSNYSEVEQFRNAISDKLSADAAHEWAFKMQKYNDNQKFKMSIVDACRSVGETFAENLQLPQVNLFKRK